MHGRSHRHAITAPGTPFSLLLVLLAVLFVAGGASAARAAGQPISLGAAWGVLAVAVLAGVSFPPPRTRPALWLIVAAAVLAIFQLLPLPPGLWPAPPTSALLPDSQWRALSLSPGATMAALASLAVPLAAWLLTAAVPGEQQPRVLLALLALVAGSMLVGALQFTGAGLQNPLTGGTPGMVKGTFANRNHFALLLAIGCLAAPAWAIARKGAGWRVAVGWALVLLFLLTILASGSRAGLALGLGATLLALLMSRTMLRRELAHRPRWVLPAVMGGLIALVAAIVLASFVADRAVSIDRLFAVDPDEDIRQRARPTVLAMIAHYFPFGSGLGGFRVVFQIHEPFHLLKPTIFNHAHNDYLEVVLDAGLPGLALLAAALVWWGAASWRAWRGSAVLPRLGSAILLLVGLASLVDYPARTPLIMAVMAIAAVWLSGHAPTNDRSPLPRRAEHL